MGTLARPLDLYIERARKEGYEEAMKEVLQFVADGIEETKRFPAVNALVEAAAGGATAALKDVRGWANQRVDVLRETGSA